MQEIQETQDSQETQDVQDSQTQDRALEAPDLSLPLEDFVLKAIDFEVGSRSANPRLTPMWTLVRAIRSHPNCPGNLMNDALDRVERIIDALPVPDGGDPWLHYLKIDRDSAVVAMEVAWHKVRHRVDIDPLRDAFAASQRCIADPGIRCRSKNLTMIASIAFHLDVMISNIGRRSFMLPTAGLAELLCTSKMAVSDCIQLLVRHGIIERVREHRFSKSGKGLASEYVLTDEGRKRLESGLRAVSPPNGHRNTGAVVHENDQWEAVLALLASKPALVSTHAIASMCTPKSMDGDIIVLVANSGDEATVGKLTSDKHRDRIASAIGHLLNRKVQVRFSTDEERPKGPVLRWTPSARTNFSER